MVIKANGRIPNRDADLARPRERKGGNVIEATNGVLLPVEIPEADPEWHPLATMLWEGALSSGQHVWYQNSDLALLFFWCDQISTYKNGRGSSMHLATIMSGLTSLLLTEGDRRRARIELEAPKPDQGNAQLYAIEGFKADLDAD